MTHVSELSEPSVFTSVTSVESTKLNSPVSYSLSFLSLDSFNLSFLFNNLSISIGSPLNNECLSAFLSWICCLSDLTDYPHIRYIRYRLPTHHNLTLMQSWLRTHITTKSLDGCYLRITR